MIFEKLIYNIESLNNCLNLEEDILPDYEKHMFQINNNDNENNEISKFVNQFQIFQYNNNIGIINENLDPNKWIEVDSFIFVYIYRLSCENKIKNVIFDYGIAKSIARLFEFYKNDLCIEFLQNDSDILEYISKQSSNVINTDMALSILRESIGFVSYNKLS